MTTPEERQRRRTPGVRDESWSWAPILFGLGLVAMLVVMILAPGSDDGTDRPVARHNTDSPKPPPSAVPVPSPSPPKPQ
jgi:hypothetical protein